MDSAQLDEAVGHIEDIVDALHSYRLSSDQAEDAINDFLRWYDEAQEDGWSW